MLPLLSWLLNVLLAASPLLLNYLLKGFFNQHPTLTDVLRNGELYIVSTGLAAAAVAEISVRWNRSDASSLTA